MCISWWKTQIDMTLFQIPIDMASLVGTGWAYWAFTLFGLKKFRISDDKIRVVETFKNLFDKERLKLSKTAQDLFSFFNLFDMLHKVKGTMRLYLVKDPV